MRSSLRRAAALGTAVAALGAALLLATLPASATSVPAPGPDVSSHNHPSDAPIDWQRVAATGAPYAFVKATEGTYYHNPYFVGDWNGIASAGMVRGTYHFAAPALPLSTAVDQANYFISYTGTTVEPGDLPPVLDLEQTGGLSPADLVAWTHTFLGTVYQLTGRKAIIYTYPYFWKNAMGNDTGFTSYPLWIADYNGGNGPTTPLPGGWQSWTFWQYTSSATIDGITGSVDANAFCCSTAYLNSLSYGGAPSPAPGASPGPTPSPTSTPVPPGAPTAVSATPGNRMATVGWSAPSATGSDPVSGYVVTPSRDGVPQTAQVFNSPATSQTVTGLVNGAQYTFTVHAVSKAGPGAESSPSSPVIPQATPMTSRSDAAGTAPSSGNPLVVTVVNPAGDPVTITKGGGVAPPAGYAPTTTSATLSAPATSDQAAALTFAVHTSALPPTTNVADVSVLRAGALLPACGTGGAAPCLDAATYDGTVLTLTVRSVPTGAFGFAVNRVGRVLGPDRIATAVATSQASFPGGGAGAVVLARSDAFADALSGTPLATARRAPLLLTPSTSLDSRTSAEISRVLPKGGTVYLLGGTAALSPAVADALTSAGYQVVRYAGADRYSTAVAVADALGAPSTVFLATGTGFADGLSAGTAAATQHAALLLTAGSQLPPPTLAYLRAHPGTRYAVGGQAAQSDSIATPLVGADRFQTAIAVARKFFPRPAAAGVASGMTFPDAMSAGPGLAAASAPLLLAEPGSLPPSVATYLSDVKASAQVVHLHGGPDVLSHGVRDAVAAALR